MAIGDTGPSAGEPLSAAELNARRGASRQRRRARRLRTRVLAVVVLLVLATVVAIVLALSSGGGGGGGGDGGDRDRGTASRAQDGRQASSGGASVGATSAAGAAGGPGSGPGRSGARRSAVDDGRAIDLLLGRTPYVRLGGRRRREVALTFDDGPGPSTPRILRILERSHTPATFFVIGRSARARPRTVGQEARAGFAVGDHTETHALLSSLSPAAQSAQLDAAALDIQRAGAPYPRLFRPPYGSFDQSTLTLLGARRLLMVLWSADTKDYSRPGVTRIVYTAVSGAQPGAIILMHDGGGDRSETAAALPRIILRLRRRGFRAVTIPQLVADDPPPGSQPPPHPLSGRG